MVNVMLEYILKKSLPIFLVLCLCILSLTGCSGNDFDDVRQTTMFPGKVVSFKSDGIEYNRNTKSCEIFLLITQLHPYTTVIPYECMKYALHRDLCA